MLSFIHRVSPLVILLALAAGCSRTPAQTRGQAAEEARSVRIEPVRAQDIRRPIEIVGTLTADEEVTISAESEGKVARILADLGDRVRGGQVLVALDREKPQYRLEQQRASLARARASYGVADAGSAFPPLDRTPDVQRAAAELAQAEQAHTRAEELHKRSLLPRQQLDDAETLLRSKRASFESALQNAKNLRADIDAAEANVRLAERELRDTEIRAPFDGFVSRRLVSLGEYVRVQTPVVALVKVDPLKLTAEVPERLAPWVKVGQPFTFTVDAYPEASMDGTIARISPAVNTETRAFPLEGLVPNRDGRLKPGTFARVRIASERVDHILTLPAAALQYRYGVNRVFVVEGDTLAAREIKIGDRLGDRVEVLEGVKGGEAVVVSDVERLAEGLRVRIARGE
jgi:RND family efflux transporter MFP subunit